MNELSELFTPYQPSITLSRRKDVIYEEQKPITTLGNYIYCYWVLHTNQPLDHPFMYRVVSDGCVDVLFEFSKPDQIFITGFSAKFLEYDLGKSFKYFGIRFLPTGFPTLFNISASKLTNNFLPLNDMAPALYSALHKYLSGPASAELDQVSSIFDRVFSQLIAERDAPPLADDRFAKAFIQILKSRGNIKLSELDVALSERQLRRLFDFYFGESPKTFAKILRFQNILGAKPTLESLKHNKIFYEEGYYDQAHFIKEFKAFYGVTPGKAFGY